ncbi:MAG: B12-binding domain-containing radical SAM protein [Candidatus Bathyarchaeota archaeon]|nr:B12-binding domain-containing radical SAM protein [Candidatus Bathyarchaeota archaeon]
MNDGFPVVLTADRTLMSEYAGGIFLGFSACVPTGLISDKLYFSLLCPSIDVNEDGSVEVAPCGTRKIEAALLEHGFRAEDVVVAHPEHLEKVVGPKTKAVGITETDPLGMGPATSTFKGIFGGEAYMAAKFRELLSHPAVKRFKPRVIVGGPGAWQLEDEETRRRLKVDCAVIGEGEKVVGPLFRKALGGEELPGVVYGEAASVDEIPVIKGATIEGLVEVARGCGRGCDFCVPTLQFFRCLPLDHILREVDVNLKAGRRPLLHAEDVLRYGAKGLAVNEEAVIELFKSVKNYPGVESAPLSHYSLASAASAPGVVEEISSILGVDERHWLSGQTGIETGSPRLMRLHMRGKCRPFAAEDWPRVVVDAFEVLSENNWVPCATLVMGLPGEVDRDVELTISLVQELRSFRSLIVPLFLVSMGRLQGRTESFTVDKMTSKHAELFVECWEHNFEWASVLFKDWSEMRPANPVFRRGLRFVLSYGIKQGKRLIHVCRDEYDYDISAMVADFRTGKRLAEPLLMRLARPFLRLG